MNKISAISATITIIFLAIFWYFLSQDVSLDLKGHTSLDERKKLISDSLNNVDLLTEKLAKDSLNRIEESKAFANINFGINEKEFKEEVEKFENETSYGPDSFFRHLGKYEFQKVWGLYHNDMLYSVNLYGRKINYNEFDHTAELQFNSLMELLTAKYGNPAFNKGIKSWTDYEDRQRDVVAGWTIGNKQINVIISCDRPSYTINVNSYLTNIYLEIWRDEMRLDKEHQEKALKVLSN